MDTLGSFLQQSRDFLPLLAALAGVSVVLAISRIVLERRWGRHPETRFRAQMVLLTLTLVGIVVVVLSLPLKESFRGQLLGFLGILLSAAIALSSTTFLGNALAGILLRVVAGFRIGDFIRIGDHVGRVSELDLLHTEIQTEDRDLTTLPNLYVVTHPVRVVRSSGTIVSTTVSLGYDVPRQKIEEALVGAADSVDLEDPFVQIKELGDFSVTYRIAGLLTEVKNILSTRSALRAAVLDALHGAGIEIVSPTFMNTRVLEPGTEIRPPASQRRRADSDKSSRPPEAVVFDKAEQAEKVEDLQVQHGELLDQIAALEAQVGESESDEVRQAIENRITRLAEERARLETVLDRARAERDDG